ncbi:MAG: DUF1778 domain-containing protein [Candidatus Dormibacteria bacterium]
MAIRSTKSSEAPAGGTAPQRKEGRLSLRANPRQQTLIRHAAEVQGKTVTSFVLDSATATAEQVLADQRTFLLDPATWDEFVSALDRPVARKPRLEALVRVQRD